LIERLCRDGHSVRALVRRSPVVADVPRTRLTAIKGALDDEKSLAKLIDGADAVVHLAGLIKARSRTSFFEVNVEGTRRLASAMAKRADPPKLILASSLAAREPQLSSYAASKRAAEGALIATGGLPWTILRPPAVYGPGDRETLPFFKGVKRGVGLMLSGEEARFSLIHVDDLAAAIAATLDRRTADRLVLELDDGAEGGHSWSSMIAAAERAMSKKAWRLRAPRALLATLGCLNDALRILPGYAPMLTLEKVRELTHADWVADSRLICSKTAWRPSIALDRGFPATIDWYRLHNLL
jgi:nucleoside-diphosphate-sugar epimerase